MKKISTLYVTLVLQLATAGAQTVVREDVHFNFYQSMSANDFVNHFSSGNGLSQIQNNGITGGCLATTDSIDWSNNRALYCSHYKPGTGDTSYTSICFKYDTAAMHPGTFQRAMSIWLIPYADFNHYIVASVTGNKKLELLTYSWANNPYPILNMLDRHWYRCILTTAFIGGSLHQVYLKADVFDLGFSGISVPALVNSSSGTINDSVLVADTSIAVYINGAARGGAIYLDDFRFEGREGYSNCVNTLTGISHEAVSHSFSIYPSPAMHTIFVEPNFHPVENIHVVIYDMMGKKLKEITSGEKKIALDVSSLPENIYFMQCSTATNVWTTKITVNK